MYLLAEQFWVFQILLYRGAKQGVQFEPALIFNDDARDAEALKRAGRDLTREKFIKALESISNFVPEGGGVPLTYGPNRRHGANAVRLIKAEKGTYVPLTGYQMFPPHF